MYYFNFHVWKILFWDKVIKSVCPDLTQSEIVASFLFGSEEVKSNVVISQLMNGKRTFYGHERLAIDDTSIEDYSERIQVFLDSEGRQDNNSIGSIEQQVESLHELVSNDQFDIDSKDKKDLVEYLKDNTKPLSLKLAFLLKYACSQQVGQEKKDDILKLMRGEYKNNNQSIYLSEYEGMYYTYYYSAHYEKDIHFGLLNINVYEGDTSSARMIIGFVKPEFLGSEDIKTIMKEADPSKAKELFTKYRDSLPSRYYQRIYLFEGVISASDLFLKLDFSGERNAEVLSQTLYLNVSRAASYIRLMEAGTYKGGLGLMMVMPHKSEPKLRVYRMGISKIPLHCSDRNNTEDDLYEMKRILRLNPTEYNRIQIQKDDDSVWWNLILKTEAFIYSGGNDVS